MTSSLETAFERSLLQEGVRKDGRKLNQFRKLELAFGSRYGHVEVRLGNTWLAVQASATVTKPRPQRPFEGLFHISTDVSSMASPKFENGRQATEEEVMVSRMIEKAIRRSGALDLESLCIVAGHKCWMIRVDCHYLNYDGGLVDASCIGVAAALKHFRRPDTSIDGDRVIIHTAEERPPVPLSVLYVPVCVTWSFFEFVSTEDDSDGKGDDNEDKRVLALVDATASEQDIRQGEMTLTITKDRDLCQITKAGGPSLQPTAFTEYIDAAHLVAQQWTEQLHREIRHDFEVRNRGNVGLDLALNLR